MRVALMGTRSFGVAMLEAVLHDGHEVTAVRALPGDVLGPAARLRGVEVFSGPEEAFVEASWTADLAVAAHWHGYVGSKVRAAPRLGVLGYHPSLLPRHRGKDAVEWTIRAGDPIAGGTAYWFDESFDTGSIAAQDWCFVDPAWNASDLWRQALFGMGLRLVSGVLADLDRGIVRAEPQDERFATREPSLDAQYASKALRG